MNLAELGKKHAKAVRKMDVAAPVDLEYMFRDGFEEVHALEGKKLAYDKRAGLYVATDIVGDELTVRGHAIFVEGNVKVDRITLGGSMVVMGELTADRVVGSDEPYTLTVVGKVKVGTAIMRNQFILQFLGGGSVDLLVDDEGAAEELVELWRGAGSKVKVKRCSDEE